MLLISLPNPRSQCLCEHGTASCSCSHEAQGMSMKMLAAAQEARMACFCP